MPKINRKFNTQPSNGSNYSWNQNMSGISINLQLSERLITFCLSGAVLLSSGFLRVNHQESQNVTCTIRNHTPAVEQSVQKPR